MELLPPLHYLKKWRDEGKTPREVYRLSQEFYERWREAGGFEEPEFCKKPTVPKKSKLPDIETLVQLYQEKSLREVAALYGASHERVRQILKAAGCYRPRPRGIHIRRELEPGK